MCPISQTVESVAHTPYGRHAAPGLCSVQLLLHLVSKYYDYSRTKTASGSELDFPFRHGCLDSVRAGIEVDKGLVKVHNIFLIRHVSSWSKSTESYDLP